MDYKNIIFILLFSLGAASLAYEKPNPSIHWWVISDYWLVGANESHVSNSDDAIDYLKNTFMGIDRDGLIKELGKLSDKKLFRPYIKERMLESGHSVFAWFIFPQEESFFQYCFTFNFSDEAVPKVNEITFSDVLDFSDVSKEVIKSRNTWLESEIERLSRAKKAE